MTPIAGENDSSSSRIVLRDNNAGRRIDPSTPGREGDVTRRRDLSRQMGPMLTILTAAHERDVVSNAPNKELIHGTRGLYQAKMQPEVQNQMVPKDRQVVTEAPPKAPLEIAFGNDRVGEGAHVHSEIPRSGCS